VHEQNDDTASRAVESTIK